MSYRKFWIENADGQTVQLADEQSKIFLNNPTGLGYSNAIEVNQYSDALSIASKEQNFATVSGELLFYDYINADRYEQYNDFITFLQSEPLTFYYQIPESTPRTFSMDVALSSIDKTESKSDGMMRCSFTLQGLSRWKGDEVVIQGSSNTYSIVNDGHMPVGYEIELEGSLSDPYVLLRQDGELYGEAKFLDTFDRVYVNSKDGEQEVILEQGGSVLPNPLSYQDLSISNGAIYVTFVKLARGTSELEIGMDSGSLTSVEIRFTPIYRSV